MPDRAIDPDCVLNVVAVTRLTCPLSEREYPSTPSPLASAIEARQLSPAPRAANRWTTPAIERMATPPAPHWKDRPNGARPTWESGVESLASICWLAPPPCVT